MGGKHEGKILAEKSRIYGNDEIEQFSLTYIDDPHATRHKDTYGTLVEVPRADIQLPENAEHQILDAGPEYRVFTKTPSGLYISESTVAISGGPVFPLTNRMLLTSNEELAHTLFRNIYDLPLKSRGRNLCTWCAFLSTMSESIDVL